MSFSVNFRDWKMTEERNCTVRETADAGLPERARISFSRYIADRFIGEQ